MCVQAQEACGPLEIDNALSMVRDLEKDLKDAKTAAEEGKLKPLPGESVRALRQKHSLYPSGRAMSQTGCRQQSDLSFSDCQTDILMKCI